MKSDLANMFADRLAGFAVDFTLNMMADCPAMYTSFDRVSNTLGDSISSFSDDQMEDYLIDFCQSVRTAIGRRKVVVNNITIDGEGFQSASYFIETEE